MAEQDESATTKSSQEKSTNSEEPSNESKTRYLRPTSVKEFTAQANDVATRVLNGEISIEEARAYASLARVVSQTVSVEVTRSRFLRTTPDLNFGEPRSEE